MMEGGDVAMMAPGRTGIAMSGSWSDKAESVLIGGISPHREESDSGSSTPPPFQEQRLHDNIERFFASQPKTNCPSSASGSSSTGQNQSPDGTGSNDGMSGSSSGDMKKCLSTSADSAFQSGSNEGTANGTNKKSADGSGTTNPKKDRRIEDQTIIITTEKSVVVTDVNAIRSSLTEEALTHHNRVLQKQQNRLRHQQQPMTPSSPLIKGNTATPDHQKALKRTQSISQQDRENRLKSGKKHRLDHHFSPEEENPFRHSQQCYPHLPHPHHYNFQTHNHHHSHNHHSREAFVPHHAPSSPYQSFPPSNHYPTPLFSVGFPLMYTQTVCQTFQSTTGHHHHHHSPHNHHPVAPTPFLVPVFYALPFTTPNPVGNYSTHTGSSPSSSPRHHLCVNSCYTCSEKSPDVSNSRKTVCLQTDFDHIHNNNNTYHSTSSNRNGISEKTWNLNNRTSEGDKNNCLINHCSNNKSHADVTNATTTSVKEKVDNERSSFLKDCNSNGGVDQDQQSASTTGTSQKKRDHFKNRETETFSSESFSFSSSSLFIPKVDNTNSSPNDCLTGEKDVMKGFGGELNHSGMITDDNHHEDGTSGGGMSRGAMAIRNPPWMEDIDFNDDIMYRYQIPTPHIMGSGTTPTETTTHAIRCSTTTDSSTTPGKIDGPQGELSRKTTPDASGGPPGGVTLNSSTDASLNSQEASHDIQLIMRQGCTPELSSGVNKMSAASSSLLGGVVVPTGITSSSSPPTVAVPNQPKLVKRQLSMVRHENLMQHQLLCLQNNNQSGAAAAAPHHHQQQILTPLDPNLPSGSSAPLLNSTPSKSVGAATSSSSSGVAGQELSSSGMKSSSLEEKEGNQHEDDTDDHQEEKEKEEAPKNKCSLSSPDHHHHENLLHQLDSTSADGLTNGLNFDNPSDELQDPLEDGDDFDADHYDALDKDDVDNDDDDEL